MKKLIVFAFGIMCGFFVHLYFFSADIEYVEIEHCPIDRKNAAFLDGKDYGLSLCSLELHDCINEFNLMPQRYQYTASTFQYLFEDGKKEGYEEGIKKCSDAYNQGAEFCKINNHNFLK